MFVVYVGVNLPTKSDGVGHEKEGSIRSNGSGSYELP